MPRCRCCVAALPHTGGDSTHYGPLTTMTNLGKRNELHSQCGHRAASMVSRPDSRPLQLQLRPRRRWSCRSSCRGSCSCTWAGRTELHWQYKARFDHLLPACLPASVLCCAFEIPRKCAHFIIISRHVLHFAVAVAAAALLP